MVVEDAVRRWYLETEKEAQRGDVVRVHFCLSCFLFPTVEATNKSTNFFPLEQKAQALLGQMLMEGYGCEEDPVKGREQAEKARRRGYRMQGVYCEI